MTVEVDTRVEASHCISPVAVYGACWGGGGAEQGAMSAAHSSFGGGGIGAADAAGDPEKEGALDAVRAAGGFPLGLQPLWLKGGYLVVAWH